jgi:hypothetical protein
MRLRGLSARFGCCMRRLVACCAASAALCHGIREHRVYRALRCLILMCAMVAIGARSHTVTVGAQAPGAWAQPMLLMQGAGIASAVSGSPSVSYPVLVPDTAEGVHALWVAVYDAGAAIGDTLFYSFWDGMAWSVPVDIVHTPGELVWVPQVAIAPDGLLYVVWTDGSGQVWYTRAPSARAGSVRAWPAPAPASVGLASGLAISADDASRVHLAYCAAGDDHGVYHATFSEDGGWSRAVYVGETGNTASQVAECRLGMAFDAGERLHLVWGQSFFQVAPVYYARSDDGGLSWRSPLEVDRWDDRYAGLYAPGRPNLVAIGRDEVHIVWFGAPEGERWHRWSADGGNTWGSSEPVSTRLRGFMEPPAMAADSAGRMHLLSRGWIDEGPSGTFYTFWQEGQWSPLSLIDKHVHYGGNYSTAGGGEFASLAITSDDTLHAVWEVGLAEIWVSRLEVDAPAAASSTVTHAVQGPVDAGGTETSASTGETPENPSVPTLPRDPVYVVPGSAVQRGPGARPLLLGGVAAAVLVGVVLLLQSLRARIHA